MKRAKARVARGRSGALQLAGRRGVAGACRALGSLAKTWAVCCPQHRCQRVCPYTWRSACHKPSAPAPMARGGPCARPRLWRSRRRACHDCARAVALPQAYAFLLAAGVSTDEDEQTMACFLQPGGKVHAIAPERAIAVARAVARRPLG
jgi:hypothetical protein